MVSVKVTKTTTTKAAPKAKNLKSQMVVRTNTVVSKNKPKKKRTKSKDRRLSMAQAFARHLLMPDLYGPFRIPRGGGSVRTVLATDRTVLTLAGAAGVPVNGFQMNAIYTGSGVGLPFTAATLATGITFGTATAAGSQFPNPTNLADINFVAGCISIQYSGTPFNAKGEILVGRSIPFVAGSTAYTNMAYYPGVVRIQLAQFYDKPIRIAAQKISPIASEFATTTIGNGDVEFPFVMLNTVDPNITITVEVTRVWEARSSTQGANVIPYDNPENSFSADLDALQDANAAIGKSLEGTITPYVPEGLDLGKSAVSIGSRIGSVAMTGTLALAAGKVMGQIHRSAHTLPAHTGFVDDGEAWYNWV